MKYRTMIKGLVILSLLLSACNSGSSAKKEAAGESGSEGVKTGIAIGERAPELVELSIDRENTIALSELRGKLVLVDFWASWCAPCRHENPHLVKAYIDYRNASFVNGEGFEIYSISLDRRGSDWIRAIETDSLVWEHHVSDLKGWKSAPAAQYGVGGIPANFLIDGEGLILARNLKGKGLEDKLQEYLVAQ